MAFHKDEAGLSLHALHAFTFANAVDRVAGTGYTITAADIGKVAKQTDTNRYYLVINNSPLTWSEISAPGGSGGINYVSNDSAEDSVSGWSAYADAAGVAPVDGTGGSPNITVTRTTSNPLRSNASFLITKDAVNRQGQGISIDFTIDRADEAKPLSIEFDYEPLSGFVAGSDSTLSDLSVYIYDLDYSTMIQPTPYKLVGGIGSKHKFLATFQSSAASVGVNARKYRLILHIGTTNAATWTFKFDGVRVGPQVVNYGSPVTDWQDFVPTGTWTTNTTYSGRYRRVGDSMELDVRIATTGAPTAAQLVINMPTGFSMDTTKFSATGTEVPLGVANILDGGVTQYAGVCVYNSSTSVRVYAQLTNSTYAIQEAVSNTVPFTFGNTDAIQLKAIVPILGWSSTVEMSNDTSTRIVAASYYLSADVSIPNLTNTYVNFSTTDKRFDTHNAWDGTKYTIPVSGLYKFFLESRWASNNAGERVNFIEVNSNGNFYEIGGGGAPNSVYSTRVNGAIILNLKAGDTVRFLVEQASGGSLNLTGIASGLYTYCTIERLSGPTQVAASEMIVARYTSGNTQAIASADSSTAAIKDYETKVIDTHNAVTTGAGVWKFTAPVSGLYRVTGQCESASGGGWDATERWGIRIFKNNVAYAYIGIDYSEGTHTNILCASGSDIVSLRAGDFIDIRVDQTCQASLGTGNNHQVNYVSIEKIRQ